MKKIILLALLCGAGLSVSAANVRPMKQPLKGNRPTLEIKKTPVQQRNAEEKLPEGVVLIESFEGWDGTTADWTPDGWTVEMKGEVERSGSWTPSLPMPYFVGPSDGNYYYAINYAEVKQDEWLISPEVSIEENMVLTFDAYIDPAFLYSLDNVDWNEYEFTGPKTVAATL